MTVLIIDTAFEFCQVGLWQDDKKLDARITLGGGQHDRVLAGMVDEMLATNSLTVKEITRIFVTTGPGRFTGLRVGIAFARGLALVHDTPVVGVMTNDALAWEVNRLYSAADRVTIMVAVKRGESFVQWCKPQLGTLERVVDDNLTSFFAQPGTTIVGMISPEARVLLEEMAQVAIDPEITYPSLEAIYQAGSMVQADLNAPVRPYYAA